jgi:hypothetical protein
VREAIAARGGSTIGRAIAVGQGAYYAATGVWPLVHMASFEAVTGRKRDRWLVRTVGVLVAAIGGTLVAGGARGRVTPELALLGAASAVGLGIVEGIHAARGRISRVYLADAAGEAALVAAWAIAALRLREAYRAGGAA